MKKIFIYFFALAISMPISLVSAAPVSTSAETTVSVKKSDTLKKKKKKGGKKRKSTKR